MTGVIDPIHSSPVERRIDMVDEAESSKTGLRRMRLLRAQSQICGTSQVATIHPQTSDLIYPTTYRPPATLTNQQPSLPHYGHSISPLFSPTPPRPLRTPAILSPGKQLSISPSGEWVTIFHRDPTVGNVGGTLAVYKSTILLPSSPNQSNTLVPFASFSLVAEPIASVYLYAPRTFIPSPTDIKPDGESTSPSPVHRAPPLGPPPPPSYQPSHGPTLVVLTSDSGIHLIHPHPVLSNQLNSVAPNSGTPTWTLNLLSCSSSTRSSANVSNPALGQTIQTVGGDNRQGKRIRAGWLGFVPGSKAVWAGIDNGDTSYRVVCVDVGMERGGGYYLRSTPLSRLPRLHPPPFSQPESPSDVTSPEGQVASELQGMYFVPLSERETEAQVKEEHTESSGESPTLRTNFSERCGVVLMFRDTMEGPSGPGRLALRSRTRLELCGFERREIELAEGFKEIGSGLVEDGPMHDWIVLPEAICTSVSPSDILVTSLVPLPSIPPFTLSLALVSLPDSGPRLTYLDLSPRSREPSGESMTWSALKGQPTPVPEYLLDHGRELVVSQGVERGCLGIVGVLGGSAGVDLLIAPPIDEDLPVSADSVARQAALTIFLALKQGVGWADVVRAAFGLLPQSELRDLGTNILRHSYELLHANDQGQDLASVLRVQVAVFQAIKDPRNVLATELIRLHEASGIFDRCSAQPIDDGPVSFDLESIWDLITVSEWVVRVLAGVMKESIIEAGRMEWTDDMGLDQPVQPEDASRAIYLINPFLRGMIFKLLSQLNVFSNFMENLEKAIHPPESRFSLGNRDPRVSEIARMRVKDMMSDYGLELVLWGRTLEEVDKNSLSEEEARDSLLSLSFSAIRGQGTKILSTLPSPSALFLADTGFAAETEYDAITYGPLPLPPRSLGRSGQVDSTLKTRGLVKCDRCGWKTGRGRLNGMNGSRALRRFEGAWGMGCLCGGTWTS